MARAIAFHPFAPLVVYSMALSGLLVTYLAAGCSPSPAFEALAWFSWLLLLALAVVTDARRRKSTPCFDFGMFCMMVLPIAVPWYCFWSRGWRGIFVIAAIFALWVGPYFIATVVWHVLFGRA